MPDPLRYLRVFSKRHTMSNALLRNPSKQREGRESVCRPAGPPE